MTHQQGCETWWTRAVRHSQHPHFRLRLVKHVEADLKVRALLKKERDSASPPPGRQSLHWVVWKVPYRVRLPWPGELPIGVAGPSAAAAGARKCVFSGNDPVSCAGRRPLAASECSIVASSLVLDAGLRP